MAYTTNNATASHYGLHEVYQDLKDKIDECIPTEIYMHEGDSSNQNKLFRCLGDGGSKRAFKLDEERVLLLPNMDADPIGDIAERWERIVEEELKITKQLASLGILSPLSEKVTISPSKDQTKGTIPAYISKSFNSFAKSDTFIIDRKNRRSSTWKEGRTLFKEDENRLDKEKWDRMTAPMLDDLVKIFAHGLPTSHDSLNIAVVQTEETGSISHEIKIFGFDFTDKHSPLALASEGRTVQRSHVRQVVEGLLTTLFCYEFEWSFPYGERSREPAIFIKELVEDYTDKIIRQLKS